MNSIFKLTLLSSLLFIETSCGEKEKTSALFDHITITSTRASAQKKNEKFIITYQGNVAVKLGDGTTITSESLTINLDKMPFVAGCTFDISNFKHIEFDGGIAIKSNNHYANAQKALLDMEQKVCTLLGNVFLEQKKVSPDDIPVTTRCQKATINLGTQEITVLGSNKEPVCTTISLEGSSLFSKKAS